MFDNKTSTQYQEIIRKTVRFSSQWKIVGFFQAANSLSGKPYASSELFTTLFLGTMCGVVRAVELVKIIIFSAFVI